jgi:hydrogenase maturation factor HypF (carbamoyltransferase family)
VPARLAADRFDVVVPQRLPCNDGGLAVGQLALAAGGVRCV